MLLVCLGACRQSETGGDQASTAESPAGRGVTSTLFAEGEAWILSSDTTTGQPGLAYPTISGVGNVVSSIDVTTDVLTNEGCRISPDLAFGGFPLDTSSPPSVEFEFDGASMRLSASSSGDEFTEGCSVEFTFSVASRGTEQALFGFNIFDVSIRGQALVSGESVRFPPLQLNRFRTPKPIACEVPPADLEGSSFSISNVQPAASFFVPPSADGTIVNIDVFEDGTASVSLTRDPFSVCFGSEGTFSFDGTSLEIESQFRASEPFPPGFPEDPACNEACAFAFNGQCDDGREGAATGDCVPGSDCADCGFSLEPPPVEEQQNGNGGEGALPDVEPTMCSVSFSGKVEECGVYLSPFGFTLGQEVLTIRGTGSFSDGESSGELTTVYLTINRYFVVE
jgi:hypothetical protein